VLRSAARDIDAAKLSAVFLQNLASLAGKVPSTKIVALLRTRLISSALKKALGIDAGEAIATFEASRKSAHADTTDAALWLAALISPEIESNEADGAALTWLRGGTRFQVIRSRTALAEATTFLRQ
jgi:DNA-binding GntR family transcriptional regulator